jgi:hypothetical protein
VKCCTAPVNDLKRKDLKSSRYRRAFLDVFFIQQRPNDVSFIPAPKIINNRAAKSVAHTKRKLQLMETRLTGLTELCLHLAAPTCIPLPRTTGRPTPSKSIFGSLSGTAADFIRKLSAWSTIFLPARWLSRLFHTTMPFENSL